MHISEGVLSVPVLAAGWGFAAVGLYAGLKMTPPEKISRTALFSAVLFLVSLVRVPVGPASVHLTMLGLTGVVLGRSVIPALFVALLLQALLFQFGGLLVLGTNTVNLGLAAFTGFLLYKYLPAFFPSVLRYFLTGATAVLVGTFFVGLSLYFSSGAFIATAKLLFIANLPLALVEGIITAFILSFLQKLLPEYVKP